MMHWKDVVIQIMFILIIMKHVSSFLHFVEILTGASQKIHMKLLSSKRLFVFWGYVTGNFRVNFFKTEALCFFLLSCPSTVISTSTIMRSLSR